MISVYIALMEENLNICNVVTYTQRVPVQRNLTVHLSTQMIYLLPSQELITASCLYITHITHTHSVPTMNILQQL